jgi:hypothetical protein
MTHAENRIPLYVTRGDENKQCANCGRGTRLIFSYGGLLWRRCRRCLTLEERIALNKFVKVGPILLPVECGGMTDEDQPDLDDIDEDWDDSNEDWE